LTVIRRCKECAKTKPVSPASGLCADCAINRIAESVLQMVEREGPIYDKWRRGILASLEEGEVTETA